MPRHLCLGTYAVFFCFLCKFTRNTRGILRLLCYQEGSRFLESLEHVYEWVNDTPQYPPYRGKAKYAHGVT